MLQVSGPGSRQDAALIVDFTEESADTCNFGYLVLPGLTLAAVVYVKRRNPCVLM